MNKPDGITKEAWDAARHALSNAFTETIPNPDMAIRVARAIQSAVEEERERAVKICETVAKRLEGREFSGSILEIAVREAVNEATHNACVILAKHIRKGA